MRHPSRGCPRGLRASPPRAREARVSPGTPRSRLGGVPRADTSPEVERGVVIALTARPTAVTPPVLGPPEVLDQAAAMAGPRAGKAPLGLHHLRAVPADLVTELPAELGQGRLGRSPAPRPRPRDPLLADHAGGVQPFPHDPAVGGGEPGGEPRDLVAPEGGDVRLEPRRLRERDRERRRSTVRFRASGAGLGTRSITPSAVAMVANQRSRHRPRPSRPDRGGHGAALPTRPTWGHHRSVLRWGTLVGHPSGPSCGSAAIARAARWASARRPSCRAPRPLRSSLTSRTRSSSTSAGSTPTSPPPWAASAASTSSAPNRARRSRGSTTIVVTVGSRRKARNLRRVPFRAEPTSVRRRPTASPSWAAQAAPPAICRSRSER